MTFIAVFRPGAKVLAIKDEFVASNVDFLLHFGGILPVRPRPKESLLDDFGHHEQAVGSGGSVAESLFVAEGRPDFVRAGYIDERKGVCGRFDIADIDLL